MLVVGVCLPFRPTLFRKAATASNSSVPTADLGSGPHDFVAAITLATPAPPATAVNTGALYDDQPPNALSRLNFDRHFSPPSSNRLSKSSLQHRFARLGIASSAPSVVEAFMAIAFNYASRAAKADPGSRKQPPQDQLSGFGD